MCCLCRPSNNRWQLRQRTASGTTFRRSGWDRLVAVDAAAVAAVGERSARLGDPALLLVEEDPGGLVELLLVGLRAQIARVVVHVGEVAAVHAIALAVHCQARALQLLEPSVETRLDALSLLHSFRVYGVGTHDSG